MANKDFFYLQLEKIFIENRMYKQPWFENAPSKEELIDRTKKELEDHMEGVYSISDDYIQKLLSIKNSHIAHYDGSKVEFDAKADRIRYVLSENKVKHKSIRYEIGPTFTFFKITLDDETRISKIQRLEVDFSLELGSYGVRLIAPLPGRTNAFGIEVPNKQPQPVTLSSIWESKRFSEDEKMHLPLAIGRTLGNEVFMFDLVKARHLLIAGDMFDYRTTIANAIMGSLIRKLNPDQLKFVLMSPEPKLFSAYEKVSRIYFAKMRGYEEKSPIISTWQQARNMLNSLMIELQTRLDLFIKMGCRNIEDFNSKMNDQEKKLPYIVIIMDEYGSFMFRGKHKIENSIYSLTERGAFAGIHFILSTEFVYADVITGNIRVNIPTRIAFSVSVLEERASRTILDKTGAERLTLGGDMLFSDGHGLTRAECGTINEEEIESYMTEVATLLDDEEMEQYTLPYCEVKDVAKATYFNDGTVYDPMLADVARLVVTRQSCSGSQIQRTFEIGYHRAESLIRQLENIGAVGPDSVSKDREVLVEDLDKLDKILHKFKIS